jgi:hypothetical protein
VWFWFCDVSFGFIIPGLVSFLEVNVMLSYINLGFV